MNLPRNVIRFEVLLYASLMLDALSFAFQDRTPTAEITDQVIALDSLISGGMILLLVYFVRLAAEKRKSWPRWVLVVALVLSVISITRVIGDRGLELDSCIEVISCALTALGLYYSFTGDARGWFNA